MLIANFLAYIYIYILAQLLHYLINYYYKLYFTASVDYFDKHQNFISVLIYKVGLLEEVISGSTTNDKASELLLHQICGNFIRSASRYLVNLCNLCIISIKISLHVDKIMLKALD